MRIAYWIVAGLLALFYLYGGGVKIVRTREQLRPMMAWVDRMPMSRVRSIGGIEVLGAVGLILPPLTGIAPWLALTAAIGFMLLQLGATRVHLTSTDDRNITLNLAVLVVTGATAWLATLWI
jgi:hypothetical protein